MSETDKQVTSVLLPKSRVAIYSADPDTLAAAEKMRGDWRFARVQIAAEEGDIDTATQLYQSQPSPDLIIVQTENIDNGLTEKLESLAACCDEATAAIVIGPVNDVYLYRKLIEMGVSDYLVKPISSDDMADVIAKTLIDRLGVTHSRLIAFIGAKGGVGVSALAQGAACGVANMMGHKTVMLDCSGGWTTSNIGFDFEPSTTLAEAATAARGADEDNLNRMIMKINDNLSVLASGSDIMLETNVSPDNLEVLLDKLLLKFPVMIADLSHASPDIARTVLSRAHQIVVVSTPFLPALRLARALVQEIKDIRGGKGSEIDFIINMQGLERDEVGKKEIEQALEQKIAASIPFSGKVFLRAENTSKTLADDKEGRQIVENHILPILSKTLAPQSGDKTGQAAPGFLGGILKKFKSK